MIFADKLIVLRKKMGLSQEELADRLDVSRQAVSKWESGQTTPDLEKIIKLSSLFNVSTDYLLKDEIVIEESVKEENTEHILSLNECKEYITHEKRAAIKLSVATFLCVMCPVALIFLSILSDESLNYISPILAVVIGLSTLFIFVLIAVIIFVLYDNTLSKFDIILKNNFSLENGVRDILIKEKDSYKNTYDRANLIGIILCIISPVFLIISAFFENELVIDIALATLFLLVATASFIFVFVDTKYKAYQRVLKNKELIKKEKNTIIDKLLSAYWLFVTALYLGISFITNSWHISWIVWPISALIYAGLVVIFGQDKEKN